MRNTDPFTIEIIQNSLHAVCDEMFAAMEEVRGAGCDVITFGQYLQPSSRHHEVITYVEPDVYERYADEARRLGFVYVASGPLVRSSYKAAEFYLKVHIDAERARLVTA